MNNVKYYRVKNKITQEEMARVMNITQQYYSLKEKGVRGFSVEELFILEEVLDVSISELFKPLKEKAKGVKICK